jgi:PRTRC genetic system ThiF family protein
MYIAEYHNKRINKVLVIGCGGTGGYVAEGLCRILPQGYDIILQDPDRVEERNLIRQNFFQSDLGKFKSQVLAERLSTNYRRAIGYKVHPFGVHYSGIYSVPSIYIGCVDNAEARRRISLEPVGLAYWIDAGNSHHSGQVLIGNTNEFGMKGMFHPVSQVAKGIPLPSVQLPSILDPVAAPLPDCATAVQMEEQSPVINQMMATLVLQAVHALIHNKLTWMASYVDLEMGTLSTVRIEPKVIARILGVRVDTLINNRAPVKEGEENEDEQG